MTIDQTQKNNCKYKLLSFNSASNVEDLLHEKNPEEGLVRIQALLSRWMRMENMVVLAAAGCSVDEGGKLMAGPKKSNLENSVLGVVEKCEISKEAKEIISWKKVNDKSESGNFEKWLSYLFNAKSLAEGAKSPIQNIIWKSPLLKDKTGHLSLSSDNTKNLCDYIEKAVFCESALQLKVGGFADKRRKISAHIPFLAKVIARDSQLGRTHLFTLNYDTLFEQAMDELGIQYHDGFTGKSSARFDPSGYGLDIHYPGDAVQGRVRRLDKFIHLYKLHGSIHWFDEGGIYKARHGDLSGYQKYQNSTLSEKAHLLLNEPFKSIQPFGIMPTSQKFTQTLEAPYAHLFRLFHSRLNQPQTFLMILGYGFGDDHVNRIIDTALTNPSLVMLVVEPNCNSNTVKRMKQYQKIGQRVFVLTCSDNADNKPYKVATFADFANEIMPNIKWMDDYMNLRDYEEKILKKQETSKKDNNQDQKIKQDADAAQTAQTASEEYEKGESGGSDEDRDPREDYR
ncbi:MAG: SIR2 family protein [Gammaproteobacteria bacterium]|nr:SIR2 family protein [Gammaproteobacteria bacterium]